MQPEEKKGFQTRKKILNTAMDLINTKGYHATTMRDIVTATGVQKGNIYYHFESKEALVTALVTSAAKAYGDYLSTRAGSGDAIEKIERILDAIVDFHRERGLKGGCLFGNLAMETADTVPLIADVVRQVIDSGTGCLADLIKAAQKAGDIKCGKKPESLATRIVGGIEGAILLARLHRNIGILESGIEDLKNGLRE